MELPSRASLQPTLAANGLHTCGRCCEDRRTNQSVSVLGCGHGVPPPPPPHCEQRCHQAGERLSERPRLVPTPAMSPSPAPDLPTEVLELIFMCRQPGGDPEAPVLSDMERVRFCGAGFAGQRALR